MMSLSVWGEMRSSQLSYFKTEMTVVLSKAGKTEINEMTVKSLLTSGSYSIKGVSHSSKRQIHFLFWHVIVFEVRIFHSH